MMRRPVALASAGLLAAAAAGCAAGNSSPGADTDQVQVVAGFYPLQFVAEQVGGDLVAVTGLAPPGVEAHDLELTPSQVLEIAEADLVIYLSEFQPAVDEAVAQHAGVALDIADVVSLATWPDEHDHQDDHDDEGDDGHEGEHGDEGEHSDEHEHEGEHEHGDEHDEDHADEHGDEDEHGDDHGHEGDDGHDHGPEDPHVWLDPDRLATIATELADQLAAMDADHASAYADHAVQLGEELAALDAEYADGLADCQRREFVVSHAAFGYLADRYDLEQIAITGLSPEDEPTPERLAELVREAREHQVTTIFFEVLVSPDVAERIADEVGADTDVLDPIEGLASGSDEDYFSLMRANLESLRTALGCA